ncbi:MAG: peptidoglycan-binding protein, partial [Candidatus Omnitrophica bacterium]|nr:peptidoglycan-binding protein [Candidatus Omnitrophota bacterium]
EVPGTLYVVPGGTTTGINPTLPEADRITGALDIEMNNRPVEFRTFLFGQDEQRMAGIVDWLGTDSYFKDGTLYLKRDSTGNAIPLSEWVNNMYTIYNMPQFGEIRQDAVLNKIFEDSKGSSFLFGVAKMSNIENGQLFINVSALTPQDPTMGNFLSAMLGFSKMDPMRNILQVAGSEGYSPAYASQFTKFMAGTEKISAKEFLDNVITVSRNSDFRDMAGIPADATTLNVITQSGQYKWWADRIWYLAAYSGVITDQWSKDTGRKVVLDTVLANANKMSKVLQKYASKQWKRDLNIGNNDDFGLLMYLARRKNATGVEIYDQPAELLRVALGYYHGTDYLQRAGVSKAEQKALAARFDQAVMGAEYALAQLFMSYITLNESLADLDALPEQAEGQDVFVVSSLDDAKTRMLNNTEEVVVTKIQKDAKGKEKTNIMFGRVRLTLDTMYRLAGESQEYIPDPQKADETKSSLNTMIERMFVPAGSSIPMGWLTGLFAPAGQAELTVSPINLSAIGQPASKKGSITQQEDVINTLLAQREALGEAIAKAMGLKPGTKIVLADNLTEEGITESFLTHQTFVTAEGQAVSAPNFGDLSVARAQAELSVALAEVPQAGLQNGYIRRLKWETGALVGYDLARESYDAEFSMAIDTIKGSKVKEALLRVRAAEIKYKNALIQVSNDRQMVLARYNAARQDVEMSEKRLEDCDALVSERNSAFEKYKTADNKLSSDKAEDARDSAFRDLVQSRLRMNEGRIELVKWGISADEAEKTDAQEQLRTMTKIIFGDNVPGIEGMGTSELLAAISEKMKDVPAGAFIEAAFRNLLLGERFNIKAAEAQKRTVSGINFDMQLRATYVFSQILQLKAWGKGERFILGPSLSVPIFDPTSDNREKAGEFGVLLSALQYSLAERMVFDNVSAKYHALGLALNALSAGEKDVQLAQTAIDDLSDSMAKQDSARALQLNIDLGWAQTKLQKAQAEAVGCLISLLNAAGVPYGPLETGSDDARKISQDVYETNLDQMQGAVALIKPGQDPFADKATLWGSEYQLVKLDNPVTNADGEVCPYELTDTAKGIKHYLPVDDNGFGKFKIDVDGTAQSYRIIYNGGYIAKEDLQLFEGVTDEVLGKLWDKLVDEDYIDENGYIIADFTKIDSADKLDLGKNLDGYKQAVYEKLKEAQKQRGWFGGYTEDGRSFVTTTGKVRLGGRLSQATGADVARVEAAKINEWREAEAQRGWVISIGGTYDFWEFNGFTIDKFTPLLPLPANMTHGARLALIGYQLAQGTLAPPLGAAATIVTIYDWVMHEKEKTKLKEYRKGQHEGERAKEVVGEVQAGETLILLEKNVQTTEEAVATRKAQLERAKEELARTIEEVASGKTSRTALREARSEVNRQESALKKAERKLEQVRQQLSNAQVQAETRERKPLPKEPSPSLGEVTAASAAKTEPLLADLNYLRETRSRAVPGIGYFGWTDHLSYREDLYGTGKNGNIDEARFGASVMYPFVLGGDPAKNISSDLQKAYMAQKEAEHLEAVRQLYAANDNLQYAEAVKNAYMVLLSNSKSTERSITELAKVMQVPDSDMGKFRVLVANIESALVKAQEAYENAKNIVETKRAASVEAGNNVFLSEAFAEIFMNMTRPESLPEEIFNTLYARSYKGKAMAAFAEANAKEIKRQHMFFLKLDYSFNSLTNDYGLLGGIVTEIWDTEKHIQAIQLSAERQALRASASILDKNQRHEVTQLYNETQRKYTDLQNKMLLLLDAAKKLSEDRYKYYTREINVDALTGSIGIYTQRLNDYMSSVKGYMDADRDLRSKLSEFNIAVKPYKGMEGTPLRDTQAEQAETIKNALNNPEVPIYLQGLHKTRQEPYYIDENGQLHNDPVHIDVRDIKTGKIINRIYCRYDNKGKVVYYDDTGRKETSVYSYQTEAASRGSSYVQPDATLRFVETKNADYPYLAALAQFASGNEPSAAAGYMPAIVSYIVQGKNIQAGSRLGIVKNVQAVLKGLGYKISDADGIFGAKTWKALKSFQKQRGLRGTGLVDSKTVIAFYKALFEKAGIVSKMPKTGDVDTRGYWEILSVNADPDRQYGLAITSPEGEELAEVTLENGKRGIAITGVAIKAYDFTTIERSTYEIKKNGRVYAFGVKAARIGGREELLSRVVIVKDLDNNPLESFAVEVLQGNYSGFAYRTIGESKKAQELWQGKVYDNGKIPESLSRNNEYRVVDLGNDTSFVGRLAGTFEYTQTGNLSCVTYLRGYIPAPGNFNFTAIEIAYIKSHGGILYVKYVGTEPDGGPWQEMRFADGTVSQVVEGTFGWDQSYKVRTKGSSIAGDNGTFTFVPGSPLNKGGNLIRVDYNVSGNYFPEDDLSTPAIDEA